MKNIKLIIVATIAITTIYACTKPEKTIVFSFTPSPCLIIDSNATCRDTLAAGIDAITGPTTCAVNSTIQLQITAVGLNGCVEYPIISQTSNGTAIALTSKVAYHGCVCTQALTPVSNTVNFTPQSAGTYILSGLDFNGNAISHTVVAN